MGIIACKMAPGTIRAMPKKPIPTSAASAQRPHPDAAVTPLAQPAVLLGGLSAEAFMRRHWQRKPLLVRQALPDVCPPLSRAELFALVERDDVESRLIRREGEPGREYPRTDRRDDMVSAELRQVLLV